MPKCPYCKKENQAKKQATKKSCPDCLFYSKMIKNKKITRQEKINIVNWALKQRKKCINCGSKEHLSFDRIIPESKGGEYVVNNIQIMCHYCNTTLKIDYSSIEEASISHTEKRCMVCNNIFPLNKNYWHRTPYKTKLRENSKSHWHGTCKECRLKKEKNNFKIKCLFCNEIKNSFSKNAKYCSNKCKYLYKKEKNKRIIKCLYCKNKILTTIKSKRKYCNNICSSKKMKRDKYNKFIK